MTDDKFAQLIPVNTRHLGEETVPTVNARDLHAALEVRRDFSNWIKDRIAKFGFQEGVDFIIEYRTPNLASGNRGASIEYFISLDMAKELAMVENNEKGRQIRRHFIEVEKEFRVLLSSGGDVPVGQLARAMVQLSQLAGAVVELQSQLSALRLTVDNPQQRVSDGGLTTVLDVIRVRAIQHRLRRPLTKSLGDILQRRCIAQKISLEYQIGTGTRLFPRAVLNEFMNDKGWDLVEAYNNRILGQGVLKLVPKKKND